MARGKKGPANGTSSLRVPQPVPSSTRGEGSEGSVEPAHRMNGESSIEPVPEQNDKGNVEPAHKVNGEASIKPSHIMNGEASIKPSHIMNGEASIKPSHIMNGEASVEPTQDDTEVDPESSKSAGEIYKSIYKAQASGTRSDPCLSHVWKVAATV
ncbi:hypothetical protein ASPBRDRAFT_225644 [Aspergillus brasiliensis CBS 101740]|uniref:Uncharacterized protein n=1 Tax=Aspergillus brasiliensis (strain CBS 101740 / IMI 381727 / IBT 21946) TaxID=767769 RepID=A0A1L9UZI3_ASPBC|nr:hypothetical protein ASPBRDRAFT_225644 [Aspergillus brasiliensis CBS 101740]